VNSQLKINNLSVAVESKEILHNITLELRRGEIGVLLGPNGSGKSTLGMALMGHPRYRIVRGQVLVDGKDILDLKPNERARMGLFLSFQTPIAVPGVNVTQILRLTQKTDFGELYKSLQEKMRILHLTPDFLRRSLNEEMSGGEKKKMELLQALVLQPKFAILDEIDTGLDVDALKIVKILIEQLRKKSGVLIITHNQKLLKQMAVDKVWVLKEGRLVIKGGREIVDRVEKEGYDAIE